MKKRLKLKSWVKVVLTLLILSISTFIYLEVGALGQLINTSKSIEILIFAGWGWLLLGQILVLASIWEN